MNPFSFQFEHPWFFLLLIPLLLFAFLAWKRKDPALAVPSVQDLKKAAGPHRTDCRKALPLIFFLAGGVFLTAGIAGPRRGLERIHAKANGIDIILAVDLSGSMEAVDAPGHFSESRLVHAMRNGELKNRLEISKDEIAKFIEARPNDRIGLIAFANRPYVVCPPTLDHAFLLANLFRMEVGVIGDGTGIAGPLASAVKRLKNSDAKSRIVVLFTDGANTVPMQISPREAAKLADTFKITVYTVGIGSENAFMEGETPFGRKIIPYTDQFDEPLLKDIADITGGRYYHAADAKGMAQAMKEIDKLEKTSAEQPVMTAWREYYPEAAWCAVAALLIGLALRSTVCLKYP